ncbi:hypothetical protein [Mucilaginibacter sp. CSA2-8R]|uniref:hypothetical protein n=1 Tax=Mucilaginibacter sp. CSA2-8R TaxID=3141542 RepID=UPI00315CB833
MKIVHTKGQVNIDDLTEFLQRDLNRLFQERRQEDIQIEVVSNEQGVQITCPSLYDSFLFDIQLVADDEIHIIKSEHYTDDVNVLTLEDIINNLLMKYPGREGISYIGEES